MADRLLPWLLSERVSLCLEDMQRVQSRICLLFTFLTQVCSFLVNSSGRLPRLGTEHIKYPESDSNAVNPNEKTAQLARKSFAGPPTQEQPQRPAPSSSDAHSSFPLQDATPAASSGRPASESPQITDTRNPSPDNLPLEPKGVNSMPRRVPEDDVNEGSTEYHAKFVAPHSSSEGEVASLEYERIRVMRLERQLSASLTAQTERDQQITQLTAKLAVKSALLEQAEANAAEAAKAAKLELREQLANMRAKLESKESELEAIRLRLTEAEKDWIKSKAEADTLRAQTAATGSWNRDEDQVTRRLMERMQAIEAEVASKRWNEKRIEDMECSNEG